MNGEGVDSQPNLNEEIIKFSPNVLKIKFKNKVQQSYWSGLRFEYQKNLKSLGNFNLSDRINSQNTVLENHKASNMYISCDSKGFTIFEWFQNFRVPAFRFELQYKMNGNKIGSNLVKVSLPLWGPLKISLNGWKKRLKQ